MYYVYLLRCAGGSLYTGITTDLKRRCREHREGGKKGAKYTRANPPLGYAAAWISPDRAGASRLEAKLKKLGHAEKETIISAGLPGYAPVPAEQLREAEA